MNTGRKHSRNVLREILLLFFDHQTLALMRWDLYLMWIRFKSRLLLCRTRLRKKLKRAPSPLFLNLGSGPRGRLDPHWINIDAVRYPGVDFLADFNRTLPLGNGTVDGIFCEHVLEHFTLEQGQRLLADCFRILRPGGTLRLVVPDGRILVEWYLHSPDEIIARRIGIYATPMESLNSYFRQRYEHKMMYDKKLLELVLRDVKYERVAHAAFGIGMVPELFTLDDDKYKDESLYMEATKPNHSQ
jgi:predicted SAM-dependent methyltransferase